ncbi:M20/M25/M40 family metallo-hydrolase [Ideonella sp. DXS29W]|uniref:M20/M25/M40 family metallo-hydrolase n=1 Tax=Ideonella lacteola TaxID=2984193 RepID=A0ABU9BN73_9BURK
MTSRRAAWVATTLASCFAASAHAGPMVWASMGEDAYRLLRRAGASLEQVEPLSVTVRAPQADGRVGPRQESVYLMQVDEEALPRLSQDIHERLNRCGGFIVHASRAEGRQTIARLGRAAQPETTLGVSYAIDDQTEVNSLLPQVQESNIRSTIVSLSTDYKNRYYTTTGGIAASDQLLQKWKALAGNRTDVTVKQFDHPSWPQKSVILEIKGTTNPNKIIVVGGHLDSTIGWTNENSIAPGGDDDASGIASLQEAMRVLLSSGYKPKRTIQFMAYAAEEVGLKGSAAIAADYKAKGKKVIGVMQLDMANYKGTSNSDITLMTDYSSAAQNQFIKDLVATYQPTLKLTEDRCGYACSDHASWTNQGYAASIPAEALYDDTNPYMHTANDTISKSGNNANHALKFAKLALSFAVELGSDGK